MKTHVQKSGEHQGRSAAARTTDSPAHVSPVQFQDNRPETLQRKELKETIQNRSKNTTSLQFADNKPRPAIQKKGPASVQPKKQPGHTSQTSENVHQLVSQSPGIDAGAPVQLAESGRWWGSLIGGAVGGAAGALAGYTYGALSATAGAVTGGVAEAVKGYQHGGLTGALTWGATGAVTGAISGASSGMLHGASVGAKLGSAAGSGIGDWWTGPDAPAPGVIDNIGNNMRANLAQLSAPHPAIRHQLTPAGAAGGSGVAAPVTGAISDNEIRLLNWIHDSLGMANFNEVARGGQVRLPFDRAVFDGLKNLGAQKRQSSHYSGTLFPSGFSQVVGEQYGTTGSYLPTVLFGQITDRQGNPYMYFQPEGNAFNPDTGFWEKLAHVKDAYRYARYGEQQGPHGTSLHTDANPISDSQYQPTISDRFGYARGMDFEAFAANLLYTSGGSRLLSGVGIDNNEFKVAAIHILTVTGLYSLAYVAWQRFVG